MWWIESFSLKYRKDLEKQGDLTDCFVLVTVTPLWQVAECVSSAPPHHTFPIFLNLNGSLKNKKYVYRIILIKIPIFNSLFFELTEIYFIFIFDFGLELNFSWNLWFREKICERQVFVKHDPNLHKTEKEIALQYFMNLN